MTCNRVRHLDGGLQAWTCLWILWLFHCDKQKHTQNVMATIFRSGCYAPYITIIATPLHFLRLPLSSIFCFIVALGPSSTLSSIAESRSAVAHDVDYPASWFRPVQWHACKCLAREIKVIMCVRVRLCRNAWELAALEPDRKATTSGVRHNRQNAIHVKLCHLASEKHHIGPKLVSEAIS